MAYSFGTTGARLVYARSFAPPTLHTVMGWALFSATGSDANPDAFNHSSSRALVGMRNAKADLHFERTRATTLGSWRVLAADAGVPYTGWFFFCWRYDGTLEATDPTCWVGNLATSPTSRTVTEISTPLGALTTGAGPVIIGNDNAFTRTWGAGSIAWIGYYDGLVSDTQVLDAWQMGADVYSGVTSHLVVPLALDTVDLSPNADTATVTSATVVASPAISPRRISGNITPALSFAGDAGFVPMELLGDIAIDLSFAGDLDAPAPGGGCTYPGPNTYPGPDTYPGCAGVTLDLTPASSYADPVGVDPVASGTFLDLAPASSYADPAGVDLTSTGAGTLDLAPASSYLTPPGVNVNPPASPAAAPRRPGGPLPWMVFGGVEIGNSARTLAYLRNTYDANGNPTGIAGIPTGAYGWRIRDYDCCSCPVLATDGAGNAVDFTRPDDIGVSVGDPAPWYDPAVPESAQFLGVLITQITGLDSTVSRAKVERAAGLGGAALGAQRAAGREIGVRAVLVATSCPGLDYGRRWLSHALANDLCSDCESYQLELRTTCPPDDRPDVGLANLYEVGLSEGPKIVRDGGLPECCDLQEVEWTLTAGNPLMYACPVVVVPRATPSGGAIVSGTIDPPEPFGTIAAQIEVDTGTQAGVGVLIRAWDQLLGDPCPGALDAECLSIRLAGLPADVRVSLDGARQRLSVTDTDGVVSDGLPYVVMSDGQAFDWPEFVGCQRVCVAVSVYVEPGSDSPPGASVAISSQHRFLT